MFSIPSAPAKQSVGETITVLSNRLSSATLLEDRRTSILGLRSFAKDYPASVSSGALRSLIGSLSKDGEDVDTVKIVLETLLMLFSPNEDSPEASDEIVLWLADEFTQRQENITLLLNILESADLYARLYSLQLLAAILSARAERTEECILTAPLGIPRLVAVLDDHREAVRNEAITLLTYLTPSSVDLQKLVAFENALERILTIIEADGGLSEGGRTVEDCFILLANLLRRNVSNQSLFRESGCVGRLAKLIMDVLRAQDAQPEVADWALAQRNRNVYAFLAVVRLFLMEGSKGTHQNQLACWRHGLAHNVLQIAFSPQTEVQIKAEALITSGDMIRNNPQLQETFAQQMIPAPLGHLTEANSKTNGHVKVYVIDGLLDLTLGSHDLSTFDMRLAACNCLKAYFSGHAEVKAHFLSRAIDGYQSGRDESSNVLTVLLDPSRDVLASDPYCSWFAAVIVFHLLYCNSTAKEKASALTEGDSANGEEVVTCIQTLAAHLIACLRRDDDARISVGYLMILLGWLYEDIDAVNDFLNEGGNVQSLIQTVLDPIVVGGDIVQGLCALLLGVVYEFSTKDSPVPRATLHSILLSRLDRDRYLDRLGKLRSHPLVRDFEVTPQKLDQSAPGLLPEVFFDPVFVDFLKDNFSRMSRAIDRAPELEISIVTNGVEKGISRDLVDSLRSQVEEKDRALQEAKDAAVSLGRQLGQEQANSRRLQENADLEEAKAKEANSERGRKHEAELRKLQTELAAKGAELERQVANLRSQLTSKDAEMNRQLAQLRKTHEAELSRKNSAHQQELGKLREAVEAEKAAKVSEATRALNQLREENSAKAAEQARELKKVREAAEAEQKKKEEEYTQEIARIRKTSEVDAERVQRRTEAETADLRATISRLEVDLMKANKSKSQELQALKEEHTKSLAQERYSTGDLEKKIEGFEKSSRELKKELEMSQTSLDETRERAIKAEAEAKDAKAASETIQAELDDLLVVYGDTEDKVKKLKTRLRAYGETVSEDDDDEDEDDDSDSEDDVD